MCKLLLIQPPALANGHSGLYTLAALATYVESDCEVRVLDPSQDDIEETIKAFSPDIIGITSYTITYPESIEIMKTARRLKPEALRIIGGVHISCLPESLDDVFDAGVVGDGEETLLDIIRNPSADMLPSVPGLCYRDGGKVRVNMRMPPENIELPVPKLDEYAKRPSQSGSIAFLTSRGCPFKCVFCYSPVMRSRVEYYPVSWVADQFEYAVNVMKADFLMLLDDTVCLDIDRLHAIADELERRRLVDYKVAVNIRSSALTDELCRALKRLNVVSWNCGFESGSDRILKQIKGQSAGVEKHREMVAFANRYGVTLNGSFIFGSPGETVEDMRNTIDFMEFLYNEKQNRRYRGGFWYFCAAPFPGTQWWEFALKKGAVSNDMDWTKLDIKNFEHHLLLDESVSEEEWQGILSEAGAVVDKSNRIF